MRSLILWTIRSDFLNVAVLTGGILLLRFILSKHISQRLKYALWLIVLVRLLFPFSYIPGLSGPQSFISETIPVQKTLGKIAGSYEEHRGENSSLKSNSAADSKMQANKKARRGRQNLPGPSSETLRPAGFAAFPVRRAGSLILGLFLLFNNLYFYKKLRRERSLIRRERVNIYHSELMGAPFLFGWSIYLTGHSIKNEKYVFAHEWTHILHGDPLWNLLRCVCLVLFWYHPMVWAAVILSKKDAELACDEGTIARLGQAERKNYGKALLDILSEDRRPDPLLCLTQMSGSRGEIKKRILMIANQRRYSMKIMILAVVLAASLTACTLPSSTKEPAPAEQAGGSTGQAADNETEIKPFARWTDEEVLETAAANVPDAMAERIRKDGDVYRYTDLEGLVVSDVEGDPAEQDPSFEIHCYYTKSALTGFRVFYDGFFDQADGRRAGEAEARNIAAAFSKSFRGKEIGVSSFTADSRDEESIQLLDPEGCMYDINLQYGFVDDFSRPAEVSDLPEAESDKLLEQIHDSMPEEVYKELVLNGRLYTLDGTEGGVYAGNNEESLRLDFDYDQEGNLVSYISKEYGFVEGLKQTEDRTPQEIAMQFAFTFLNQQAASWMKAEDSSIPLEETENSSHYSGGDYITLLDPDGGHYVVDTQAGMVVNYAEGYDDE